MEAVGLSGETARNVLVTGATGLVGSWLVRRLLDGGARVTALIRDWEPESELIRFFGAVADKSPITVAIQNAPQYLGIGLSVAGIKALNRAHPNVTILKLEATALAISALVEATEGAVDVFNGRGGIEMPDTMRAGAVGNIPGGETYDVLTKVFDRMASGTAEGEAEAAAATPPAG